MKTCTKCLTTFSDIPDSFHRFKNGYRATCKQCRKSETDRRSPEYKRKRNEWLAANKERIAAMTKEKEKRERELFGDTIRAQDRARYLKNKEKVKIQRKIRYLKNRDKIMASNRAKANDPLRRIMKALAERPRRFLKKNTKSTGFMIGCQPEQFREWLTSWFTPEMTLDNYGSYWHIDHEIPCSAWDLTNNEHVKACFHWTNLKPLEAFLNGSKGGTNRIGSNYSPHIAERLTVLRCMDVI